MKVIGLTSGIGSMLIGAKQLGMEVGPNIDWRHCYRLTKTYENNFNAPIVAKVSDLSGKEKQRMVDADIAFGHP